MTHSIFLLDDDSSVRTALKLLLQALKFTVTDFEDPAALVEELKSGKSPDFILSDLKMPKMSGIEVLVQVLQVSPETPFILMSGHALPQESRMAIDLGAKGFLAKPFSPSHLFDLIKTD